MGEGVGGGDVGVEGMGTPQGRAQVMTPERGRSSLRRRTGRIGVGVVQPESVVITPLVSDQQLKLGRATTMTPVKSGPADERFSSPENPLESWGNTHPHTDNANGSSSSVQARFAAGIIPPCNSVAPSPETVGATTTIDTPMTFNETNAASAGVNTFVLPHYAYSHGQHQHSSGSGSRTHSMSFELDLSPIIEDVQNSLESNRSLNMSGDQNVDASLSGVDDTTIRGRKGGGVGRSGSPPLAGRGDRDDRDGDRIRGQGEDRSHSSEEQEISRSEADKLTLLSPFKFVQASIRPSCTEKGKGKEGDVNSQVAGQQGQVKVSPNTDVNSSPLGGASANESASASTSASPSGQDDSFVTAPLAFGTPCESISRLASPVVPSALALCLHDAHQVTTTRDIGSPPQQNDNSSQAQFRSVHASVMTAQATAGGRRPKSSTCTASSSSDWSCGIYPEFEWMCSPKVEAWQRAKEGDGDNDRTNYDSASRVQGDFDPMKELQLHGEATLTPSRSQHQYNPSRESSGRKRKHTNCDDLDYQLENRGAPGPCSHSQVNNAVNAQPEDHNEYRDSGISGINLNVNGNTPGDRLLNCDQNHLNQQSDNGVRPNHGVDGLNDFNSSNGMKRIHEQLQPDVKKQSQGQSQNGEVQFQRPQYRRFGKAGSKFKERADWWIEPSPSLGSWSTQAAEGEGLASMTTSYSEGDTSWVHVQRPSSSGVGVIASPKFTNNATTGDDEHEHAMHHATPSGHPQYAITSTGCNSSTWVTPTYSPSKKTSKKSSIHDIDGDGEHDEQNNSLATGPTIPTLTLTFATPELSRPTTLSSSMVFATPPSDSDAHEDSRSRLRMDGRFEPTHWGQFLDNMNQNGQQEMRDGHGAGVFSGIQKTPRTANTNQNAGGARSHRLWLRRRPPIKFKEYCDRKSREHHGGEQHRSEGEASSSSKARVLEHGVGRSKGTKTVKNRRDGLKGTPGSGVGHRVKTFVAGLVSRGETKTRHGINEGAEHNTTKEKATYSGGDEGRTTRGVWRWIGNFVMGILGRG
ncbi:hypothetical protein AX16_010269 [Volvariella volvacea WC 439]|nr:hypothetical protein AX16_010269 [Volvariella volvacea WC 439]